MQNRDFRVSEGPFLGQKTKTSVSRRYLGCRIQFNTSSISPELFDQFSDSKLKSTLGQEFPSLGLLFPAVHRFSWDNSKEKNDFITLFSMIELFAG